MISYVKGTYEECWKDGIVIETGGIGYHIFVPAGLPEQLPAFGKEIKVYTHLHVKEDLMQLYGFLSLEDLELFRMLIGVSGIGPKGALGILSVLSASDLKLAIVNQDAKKIAKAPGIGLKTAQKAILELKDKVQTSDVIDHLAASSAEPVTSGNSQEAVLALVSLGYSEQESTRTISKIGEKDSLTVEELIMEALKRM